MIKSLISFFLVVVMMLSLCACGSTDNKVDKVDKEDNQSNVTQESPKDGYNSDVLSNKQFVKMFEDSFQYVDKQYNPSEKYLTNVDGKIKDYYKGYDGDYFLTNEGLYCSMWGGPHYTSEIKIDIGNNTKIVYVGFSIIILADEDGNCQAWQIEREAPDYKPSKYHTLNVPKELSDAKLSEAGMTSLCGYTFNSIDKFGINTTRVGEDYNGGLSVTEGIFAFREELQQEPVKYILPEEGRGIDGIILFEDGIAKKVDIAEDENYSEYAALPYKDIENVNEIFPAFGATTWCITKRNENNNLYIYTFNNLMAYDMYEYKFSDLPFDVNDIVKCFCQEAYTEEVYVLLKNNDLYKLRIMIECYDESHNHSDIDEYRKEHSTINKVVYTKDGVMNGMFEPVVIKMTDLKGIIKEWNVIKVYSVDGMLCFIMDDGKNYVYTGEVR